MKRLRFRYEMELTFDALVVEHHFVFRCLPLEDHGQRCYGLQYGIEPSGPVHETTDGFGNRACVGEALKAHDSLRVWSQGTVFSDRSRVVREKVQPLFRFPSPYTAADEDLVMYLHDCRRLWQEAGNFPLYLMDCLYRDFSYVPGRTSVATTAAQAWEGREGVCQDYAHIFLSLCRLAGYPARYVAGMMKGEGATHAWAEVYEDGAWTGFDPTHNRLVDDDYIKLSHGRDFGDCTVDKGCFKGFAAQKQNIYVKVDE